MNKSIRLELEKKEFKKAHKKQLDTVVDQIVEVMPEQVKVDGVISKATDTYEGKIYIRSKIGSFMAKARSRNLFALIARLQAKAMRQIVNWKEARRSKKRYLKRRHLAAIEKI